MENIYTRPESDNHSTFSDMDEESQNQDSSSEEYKTAPSSPKHIPRIQDFFFSSEMDPSELAGHLADKAPVSASQYCSRQCQLESQVHTSSGCSLTDPKIVHQPRISSRETYCNFLPGQLEEQARRFWYNIKYASSFRLELQREIAEAGFVISESKRFISCQYCGFQVISDFLNTGCNLWAMHYEHCCHLLVYQVDQERQGRPAADQGNTITATTRILTEYRSSQSISSTSRGQHSGSFSGQSEGDEDSVLSREMQLKLPTDLDLGILSRSIGIKYTQLGVHLGLQFQRIKEIEVENHIVSNRCLAILVEWRDTQRRQATLGKLEKVFQTLNLNTENFRNLSQ